MNERIKKLSEQAYDDIIERTGDIVVFQEEFQQRFAELVVLECAVIVGSMEEPHQDIAELIKQHFGVEE